MKPYYSDDLVTIYHADCREWMPEADVIVTDPPYGIGWKQHGGGVGKTHTRKHGGIQNDSTAEARDWLMETRAETPKAIFGSFRAAWPTVAIRQVLIFQKGPQAGLVGSVTGFRTDAEPIFLGPWPLRTAHSSSVIRTAKSVGAADTGHPHEKPLDVMVRLIESGPLGTVLDPFMGSGSTLVAAKMIGTRAIGIEIEERYCEIAALRCSQEVLGLEAA